MPSPATSYLVTATQRSGSTLLVESLRASGCAGEPQEFFQYLPDTGMAPQPREWFAGVDDESILRIRGWRRRRRPNGRPISAPTSGSFATARRHPGWGYPLSLIGSCR